VIITTEMNFYHSIESNSVWCNIYLTTFRRKDVQDFSFVKLNLSCSKCNFDADKADENIQMLFLSFRRVLNVNYSFLGISPASEF